MPMLTLRAGNLLLGCPLPLRVPDIFDDVDFIVGCLVLCSADEPIALLLCPKYFSHSNRPWMQGRKRLSLGPAAQILFVGVDDQCDAIDPHQSVAHTLERAARVFTVVRSLCRRRSQHDHEGEEKPAVATRGFLRMGVDVPFSDTHEMISIA